jgi:serine/threonine-protein phosphatase 2A regulatory subunit A
MVTDYEQAKLFLLSLTLILQNEIHIFFSRFVGNKRSSKKFPSKSKWLAFKPSYFAFSTIEHLLPMFLSQLKDDCPEVRLNIISNLVSDR